MRIILVSDIHTHPWQEFARITKGGLNTRLLDCVRVYDDILKWRRENDVTIQYLINGGDLFHKKGVVFTQAYNLVVKRHVKMKEAGLKVLAVDGNHDHADKAGRVHALQALHEAGLLHTLADDGSVTVLLRGMRKGDDLVVSLFSYCDSRDKWMERVETEDNVYNSSYKGVKRIGVFHHGFVGARVGSTLEYVVKEEIDPRLLNGHGFDYVFSGHYHTRQVITGPGLKVPAMYIGSPLEHMRSNKDVTQDKGFLVYDSETNEVEFVPLKRPVFMTLTQEVLDKGDFSKASGNFVDVVWEEYPGGQEKLEADLREAEVAGMKLTNVKRKSKASAKRLDIDPSLDAMTILKRYIAHEKDKIAAAKLDPKELLTLGSDLLNKATK